MSGVNKVILIGNLGADPEQRHTPSGAPVVTFNIATSESWIDKTSGEKIERTEWHRIVVWGKQGESCMQFLTKGRSVYVEGRLQTKQWEDKQGNKRYTTEINAQTVTFLGGQGEGAKPAGHGQSRDTGQSQPNIPHGGEPRQDAGTMRKIEGRTNYSAPGSASQGQSHGQRVDAMPDDQIPF